MWIVYLSIAAIPAYCFHAFFKRIDDDFATSSGFFVFSFQLVAMFLNWMSGSVFGEYVVGIVFVIGLLFGYGAWHTQRLEAMTPMPIGKHIVFAYRDWKFRFSKRRVKVTSFDNQYITGFCEMRQAERTFRRDRVQNGVIVEETGEVIDPCAPAFPDLHKK